MQQRLQRLVAVAEALAGIERVGVAKPAFGPRPRLNGAGLPPRAERGLAVRAESARRNTQASEQPEEERQIDHHSA